MASGIAVLMYHELEQGGRDLCQSDPGYIRYVVPASVFADQMGYLKSLGYEGISVGRAIESSIESRKGKRFVLTFDDGCETDLEIAAEVLTPLDFGATFYVTVGFIGQCGYMTVTQLHELIARGFEVGCHSLTHPYLTDLDSEGRRREIVESKMRLEQIMGRRVEHFSCPGGRVNQRVVEDVKQAGYRTLATSQPRLNFGSGDPYTIDRVSVMRSTTKEELAKLCQGRGILRLKLQQASRSGAKKLLGNRAYDRLRSALLGGPRPH